MSLGNDLECEDICIEDTNLDLGFSDGLDPIEWMVADPNESREERKKRLDLICHNVIDGILDINDLLIFDMIAVILRMQEMDDEADRIVLQAEQEVLEQE